jgi:hypothetical protein
MPFKSLAQQKYLYAKKPEIAEEFSAHTPKSAYKKLPERVKDKNKLKEYSKKHGRRKNA